MPRRMRCDGDGVSDMNDENEEALAAVSVTLPPFEPERHVAAIREAMDRAEIDESTVG
jgi:hypothetical protein